MFYKSSVIVFLFSLSLYLGFALMPKVQENKKYIIDLEQTIPLKFDEWKNLESKTMSMISPRQQEVLDKIYTQTIERTYINSKGQPIMLSIAYGTEQRKSMLVHFPEVCYPAQGFNLNSHSFPQLKLLEGNFTVKHLETQKGDRVEDVTYWVRVGDELVSTRPEQKWVSIKYGVKGIIPDGLLFRVSSIGIDGSFELHQDFIEAMFKSLDDNTKSYLAADYYQ